MNVRFVSMVAMRALIFSPFSFLLFLPGCGGPSSANSSAAVAEANNYTDVVAKFGGKLEMRLDLSNSDITDDDLATLPLSDGVRSIDLSHTKITDAGIEHLKRASHLEQLNLMDTEITDTSLEHIRQMENLWSVSIEGTKVSRDGHMDLLRLLAPRAQAHHARPKP
jgi:hypothetical protein